MNAGIALQDVTVRAGKSVLVDAVSLTVEPGDFVALVGPNGAGKSTLLRALLGLRDVDAGLVKVDGLDVHRLSGRDRAKYLGWLPQGDRVDEAVPVLDLVMSGRFRFDEPRSQAQKASLDALAMLGVSHLSHRTLNTLSGGEGQRVSLAVLQAQEPDYLLLDEPANHLDPAQQLRTYEYLGQEWAKGRAVVCVTHDVNLLRNVESFRPDRDLRVVGVRDGRSVFESSYGDPDLAGHLSELFGVHVDALTHAGGTHFAVTGGAHE